MADPWGSFAEQLDRLREAGRTPAFWWRDDDAGGPTAEIGRLLDLSASADVPLALAVVPAKAEAGLFRMLHARCAVLQHGTDHVNRAGPGEKKTEFPAGETEAAALARLAAARTQLAGLAGTWTLPVLAPPWNRIRASLAARLPEIGVRGLSAYGATPSVPLPGLRQANTHVDIIAWQAGRGFAGDEASLRMARAALEQDTGRPVGILTHHAVHDSACWSFLERLFDVTRRCGARWLHPATVFLPAGV